MDILLVKMDTGEELVARLVEQTAVAYVVEKPFVMRIIPTASGQITITMVPWFLSDPTATVELYKDHVIGQVKEPNETLKSEYLSKTSGIQIASAGILNG